MLRPFLRQVNYMFWLIFKKYFKSTYGIIECKIKAERYFVTKTTSALQLILMVCFVVFTSPKCKQR